MRVNSVAMRVTVWLAGRTICDQTNLIMNIALIVGDQLKVRIQNDRFNKQETNGGEDK
jgi:hypothetical protein